MKERIEEGIIPPLAIPTMISKLNGILISAKE